MAKRTSVPMGTASLAADMTVVALSVPVFGIERPVLMVVLTRPEMAYLRHIVAEVDPRATVIVGKIHEASYNDF